MDATSYSLILPSGVILAISGVVLIVFGTRLRRQALTRRIDRLRPPDTRTTKITRRNELARNSSLARPEGQRLTRPQQREASRRLAGWGIAAQSSQAIFVSSQALCAAAIAVITILLCGRLTMLAGLHAVPVLVAAVLGLAGWFLPPFILQRLVKRRAKAAADGLPDALELLVVCVEAGLSLENAIDRIIGELARSQPALAAELALTSADLKILPSRDQALANLAERVDVPSVRSVVSTLSQTLRYGTPLAQAMRVVAAQMRTEALIDLEERANRLPAIMTVPMMLFIMPVIFLIVGGPAVLRLLDMLAHR
jgi:tight adherence protein C